MNKETQALIHRSVGCEQVISTLTAAIREREIDVDYGVEMLNDYFDDADAALVAWARGGFPVVRYETVDDAMALAETEPLTTEARWPWESMVIGVEIGAQSLLVDHEGAILCLPEIWLDSDQLDNLVSNTITAMLQRPEGLRITEHRPSAKAARKRGRRYYPNIEYIIGSTTALHRRRGVSAASDAVPEAGWTLSVRTQVRGHWRQQACGAHWSQHRTIWIAPHWRGPDDAPVSVHGTGLRVAS